MPNSIRTPRQGTTAGSRRIAQAVDDEGWQNFRVSLKGKSTQDKLYELDLYYSTTPHAHYVMGPEAKKVDHNCDVCIRVDNYIKALCRGGQLYPGESLETVLDRDWAPSIKS